MRTGFAAAALALGLATWMGSSAEAQMFNQVGKNSGQQKPQGMTPPPALPGAAGTSPAPLTRVPTDMEPNEALFDAINRGDIATARDAISRGADLHARNILGMTPLELSVDLGRNDISFMLLSMRAADDTRPAQPKRATAGREDGKPPVRQAKKAPTRPPAPAAASTQQTARLFSGDGGTPNPDAGFLGFDSGRR